MVLTQEQQAWKTKSIQYWKDREEAYFASQMSSNEQISKRMEKYFTGSQKAIEDRIDAFYGKYAKDNGITKAVARQRASVFDVQSFAERVAELIRSGNISEHAREELKLYNLTMKTSRLELLKMNIDLEAVRLYSDVELDIEGSLFREAKNEYVRQSGILGMSVGNQEEFIKTIINADFFGATWSENVWGINHALTLRRELSSLIRDITIQGRNPRVFVGKLSDRMKTNRYNAERLLNTEANRVNTMIKKDSYTQAQVQRYEYYAEPTACAICAELNGSIFKVSDMQPGMNAKPMHPFCMCGTLPVSDRDEWLEEIESRMENG